MVADTKPTWTKYERLFGCNYLLDSDGFHVSYNPNTRAMGPLAGDGDGAETALYHRGQDKYFILNGDHRAAYEARIGDWDACFAYYTSKKAEAQSSWSSDRFDEAE